MVVSNKQKIKDAAKKASKRHPSVIVQASSENDAIAGLCLEFYRGSKEEQAQVIAAVRGAAEPMRFMAVLADMILEKYGTGTLRRFLVAMARADQ